jgi:tetratricopeptide (TPR) repeat protein
MKTLALILGLFGLFLAVAEASASPGPQQSAPEAVSLFGQPLYPLELAAEERAELEANLARARAEYDQDPSDPERLIWLGRRLGYLWRYRDAIAVFSKGIELHPQNPRLYRHRGHRYISVRRFEDAIADLEKAAALIEGTPDEVEPDGAPNPANLPRSSLHTNVWYHLGLAHYLKGDFESAERAYLRCLSASRNDDMRVATLDWLYMTYRRRGRKEEAEKLLAGVQEKMDIVESFSYHKRLLMYIGLLAPETLLDPSRATDLDVATQGYGVGNWYFYSGDGQKAREVLEKVLAGRHWSAFGYIAAEADLVRMERR